MQDAINNKGFFSAGSYRLTQLLGPGPLSRTYLAEHQDDPGKRWVLKMMEATPLTSEEAQARILQEVLGRQNLEHQHILVTREAWIQEQILYLVTPYAEGGSLRLRLDVAPGSPLPLKEALTIIKGIGQALHFAHQQNIVHANLKPENILLQVDGTALLVDFRLPTLVQSARAIRACSATLASYMAPEQFQTSGVATPLSDQYSLACLACELLTGSPPFEADTFDALAHQHMVDLALFPAFSNREQVQYLETPVLKALAKEPAERYADVQAFITALSAPPSLAPYVQTTILPAFVAPVPAPGSQPQPALILPGTPSLQTRPDTPTLQNASGYLGQQEAVISAGNRARIPMQAAAPPELPGQSSAPRTSHLTKKQRWLMAIIIGLTICLTFSLVLALFQASLIHHPVAGISQFNSSYTALTPAGATSTTTINSAPTPTATVQNTVTPTPVPTATPSPTSATTPTQGTTATTTSCAVSYTVTSKWSNGFVASIQITNSSPATLNGWTLAFTFPGGDEHITGGWNGNFTQTGLSVSATNASFNNQIQANGSVTLGFQASATNTTAPTSFTLNNVACSVAAS